MPLCCWQFLFQVPNKFITISLPLLVFLSTSFCCVLPTRSLVNLPTSTCHSTQCTDCAARLMDRTVIKHQESWRSATGSHQNASFQEILSPSAQFIILHDIKSSPKLKAKQNMCNQNHNRKQK